MEEKTKLDYILTAMTLIIAGQIKAKKTTTSDCIDEAARLIKNDLDRVLQALQ